MRAIIHDEGAESTHGARLTDAPIRSPRRGEVAVALEAAAIHATDLAHLRSGRGLLGQEGVGRIIQLGADVDSLLGDRVLLPLASGTWRDHLVVSAAHLVPVPAEADPLQLALALIHPATATALLEGFVELRPGEWIVQSAAHRPVGLLVAQLARQRGIRTVNLVPDAQAATAVRRAGGDVVVHADEDVVRRVQDYTGGAQIRLGLDATGGTTLNRLASCLTHGGTIVHHASTHGEVVRIDPDVLTQRDLRIRGFWLTNWLSSTPAPQRRARLRSLAAQVAYGDLTVPIAAAYAFDAVDAALAHAARADTRGAVVLTGAAFTTSPRSEAPTTAPESEAPRPAAAARR